MQRKCVRIGLGREVEAQTRPDVFDEACGLVVRPPLSVKLIAGHDADLRLAGRVEVRGVQTHTLVRHDVTWKPSFKIRKI